MPLISCAGVSMGYGGNIVLSGVDFSVEPGDYLCVAGENGSGKSTLVKGLLRLMTPVEGRIEYGDGLSPDRIGYLPQRSATGVNFPAGVLEVVLSGCLGRKGFRPFYSARDKSLAMENLRRLGVDDLRDKCFEDLSGGQQQRVLVARALCSADSLLILDEPVAGLDPIVTQDFYDVLWSLHSSEGLAIVMVSHDVGRAVSNATHVLHLRRRQEFFGTVSDYLRSEIGKKFVGGDGND
jgi:zinc transport system ATP-binding protein